MPLSYETNENNDSTWSVTVRTQGEGKEIDYKSLYITINSELGQFVPQTDVRDNIKGVCDNQNNADALVTLLKLGIDKICYDCLVKTSCGLHTCKLNRK
jgi:hypothetical protein